MFEVVRLVRCRVGLSRVLYTSDLHRGLHLLKHEMEPKRVSVSHMFQGSPDSAIQVQRGFFIFPSILLHN